MRSLLASWVVAVAAFAGGATGAPEGAPGPEDGSRCGHPGQPPCPMQAWMRDELGAPLGAGKGAEVAAALDRLARDPPDPAWVIWRTSAADGASAARRGDMPAVRRSCRVCHDAHRAAYRERFRTRPPPP